MTAITPSICANSAMSNWPGGSSSKVLLLNTGGYPASSVLSNQTNLFNGTTPNWSANTATVMDPAGPLPGRSGAVLGSYDGTNLILNGGNTQSANGILEDSWLYTGSWAKAAPATVPTGRYDAAGCYLSGTGFLMFGGATTSETPLQDTQVFNGTNWSAVSVANGTGPAARFGHCMAAHTTTALMCGGALGGNVLANDFWTYTTVGGWVQKMPTTFPQARTGACLVWDATASLFILFGGTSSSGVILNDLWHTTDGVTWTQVSVANGVGPSGRVNAQMAYDAVSGSVILFGGVSATIGEPDNQTWKLVSGTTWSQL